MPVVQAHKATVWEDSGLTVMARILGNDGSAIQRADFGTITYAVHEHEGAEITGETALTVASVVFDTPVTKSTDTRWPHDDSGYNFLFTVPATGFPDATAEDKPNAVEIKFAPTTGEPFHVVWAVDVAELKRS